MIRMLVAGDGRHLVRAVILHGGLAWQVGNPHHPAEPGFRAVLPDRDHPVRLVDSAGHDLDPRTVDAAEAERRAARRAEIALCNRGRSERGGLAPGPGEVALLDIGERGEGRAGCLLTHPAMTDADL